MNNPATSAETFVMPAEMHNGIVAAAYRKRGYTPAVRVIDQALVHLERGNCFRFV